MKDKIKRILLRFKFGTVIFGVAGIIAAILAYYQFAPTIHIKLSDSFLEVEKDQFFIPLSKVMISTEYLVVRAKQQEMEVVACPLKLNSAPILTKNLLWMSEKKIEVDIEKYSRRIQEIREDTGENFFSILRLEIEYQKLFDKHRYSEKKLFIIQGRDLVLDFDENSSLTPVFRPESAGKFDREFATSEIRDSLLVAPSSASLECPGYDGTHWLWIDKINLS